MSSIHSTDLRRPNAPALAHSRPRTASNRSLSSLSSLQGAASGFPPRPITPQHSAYSQGNGSTSRHGAVHTPSPTPVDPFFSPTPPFAMTSSAGSPRGNTSPLAPHELHQSTSNSSLRSASLRPTISNPGDSTPSPGSSRQWSRTHCPSPSAPPRTPSPWGSTAGSTGSPGSRPAPLLVRTKPGSPPMQGMQPLRSTSETWSPSAGMRSASALGGIAQSPMPRLHRKKSSVSLLVSGIGRGLGRVGSVMRRGGSSNGQASSSGELHSGGAGKVNGAGSRGASPAAQTQPPYTSQHHNAQWASRRPLREVASSQLGDLCEDEDETRVAARSFDGPVVVIDASDTPVETMSVNSTRKLAYPPQSPLNLAPLKGKDSGVSLPFNVQHELHVSADLDGLPDDWILQLKANGLSDADLLLILAAQKRQRAVANIPLKPIQPVSSSMVEPLAQSQHKPKKLQAVSRRLSRYAPAAGATPAGPVASVTAAPVSPASVPPSPAGPILPSQVVKMRPANSRSESADSEQTMNSTKGSSGGGATGVYRKPSIISKLLDDLDSVSAHPSRPPQTTLCPPPTPQEASDSESDIPLYYLSAGVHSPRDSGTQSHRTSTASAVNIVEDRRLSEELRGFRDIRLPGEDDGWASSVLAAWNDENSIAMNRTRTASPAPPALTVPQRIPEPVGPSVKPPPPPVAAGFGLAVTPPSKPQSLRSVRRTPSPAPPSFTAVRRRSRSFDFDPAMRATLYSPPPPPPHSRKTNTAFHSLYESVAISAVPIVEKRRRSVDSFGNHPDDDESCGTRSRSGSELDLGTPPLDSEGHAAQQSQPPTANKSRNSPSPLHIISPRRGSILRVNTNCENIGNKEHGAECVPDSVTSADMETFPGGPPRFEHFSCPSSVVSHSQTSTSQSSSNESRPQSQDSSDAISFGSHVPAMPSLGLCLTIAGDSPSSTRPSHGGSHPYSTGPSHALPHSGHSYASYPKHKRTDSTEQGNGSGNVITFSGGMAPLAPTKTTTYRMSDDIRLTDNRTSMLSRMSSIASSVNSYSIHEATVHRAYTGVLRRVNEDGREEAENADAENVSVSTHESHDPESAMGALEEAAWRVAFREGGRVTTRV